MVNQKARSVAIAMKISSTISSLSELSGIDRGLSECYKTERGSLASGKMQGEVMKKEVKTESE